MKKMNNILNQITSGLAFGWHMAGYGTGYSVTTAKLHTKELSDKVKATKIVTIFTNGYAEGSDKAVENYYDKKAKAYAKAKAEIDEEAAEAALREMVESMVADGQKEEQVEEPAPKNNIETRETSTSLLGQDMMSWFVNNKHWRLTFDDASIVGAAQYCKDNQRGYVFQEGSVISQYIPNGYCTKYVLKGTSTIVALEYADGMRIDLFDNGFIITK